MELGEKDLPHGMPTPAASTVRQLMATALAEDYRGQDIVALHDMYRRWARKGGEK
jgi:hypothetical protein